MINETLAKHIKSGSIAPSYLLIDRDILKLREISKWFSESYDKADIFRLEGNPSILVKETEEFVALSNLMSVGDKKLFIICDASLMTIAAQNKILKTIEDTPAETTFMLLASSASKILNTIKSRCVTIYPDPVNPSITEAAVYAQNPNTKQIFSAAEDLLVKCKTLDDALSYLPLITKQENLAITLAAINYHASKLTTGKRNAILKRLAIINRNIAAGCNAQNLFDTILLELYK